MNFKIGNLLGRSLKHHRAPGKISKTQPVVTQIRKAAPVVSIVMPSLNQVEFIEDAILSILNQEEEINLELIVVDGGSTDGTQKILAELALEYRGCLRWYSEYDDGPAEALNKAIRMTNSEIIGWLNADDIYAPGAIIKGYEALKLNPNWVMVYGHGQHINRCGETIGTYPTLTPDKGYKAFADGCFICQPTVFLRKSIINETGGLDENLKTAFDFDLWLRLFKRAENSIGFIDHVLAYSRLHAACITKGQREQVIQEGMRVVSKHMKFCPPHWFYTYLDELLSNYPHGRQINDLVEHIGQFAQAIQEYVSPEDFKEIKKRLKTDERIRITVPDAYLDVYSDGWLSTRSTLRVRSGKSAWRAVEITGERVQDLAKSLVIHVYSSDGTKRDYKIPSPEKFSLKIELDRPSISGGFWDFTIESTGGFIPRELDISSDDTRELACKIHALKLTA